MFHVPETTRHHFPVGHPLYSDSSYGNNGVFDLGRGLRCIASDGGGWEHLSVSYPDRTPSWDDMCLAKRLFWDEEDCVVQFHPPKSAYVNHHPHCLHLWRQVGQEFNQPPTSFVGPTSTRRA